MSKLLISVLALYHCHLDKVRKSCFLRIWNIQMTWVWLIRENSLTLNTAIMLLQILRFNFKFFSTNIYSLQFLLTNYSPGRHFEAHLSLIFLLRLINKVIKVHTVWVVTTFPWKCTLKSKLIAGLLWGWFIFTAWCSGISCGTVSMFSASAIFQFPTSSKMEFMLPVTHQGHWQINFTQLNNVQSSVSHSERLQKCPL